MVLPQGMSLRTLNSWHATPPPGARRPTCSARTRHRAQLALQPWRAPAQSLLPRPALAPLALTSLKMAAETALVA